MICGRTPAITGGPQFPARSRLSPTRSRRCPLPRGFASASLAIGRRRSRLPRAFRAVRNLSRFRFSRRSFASFGEWAWLKCPIRGLGRPWSAFRAIGQTLPMPCLSTTPSGLYGRRNGLRNVRGLRALAWMRLSMRGSSMGGKRDLPRPRVDFAREQRLELYAILNARDTRAIEWHGARETGKVSQFR